MCNSDTVRPVPEATESAPEQKPAARSTDASGCDEMSGDQFAAYMDAQDAAA